MSRSGIPLLSGPPPPYSGPPQDSCKKCGREFHLFYSRQRKCMHCGYGYCSSCIDYQALMPRRGPAHGHDAVHVCAFCIDMLNVTALGRSQLRSIPLAKLKRYIDAYNIQVKNPVDKNDLVDAALAARTSQGCLSSIHEDYYRKHSVPPPSTPSSSSTNRSSTARAFPNTTNANSNPRPNRSFPRPDLDPNRRQRPHDNLYNHTPGSAPSTRSRTTSAPLNPGTIPTGGQPNISRSSSPAGRHPTPRPTSTTQAPSHSQAVTPMPPPPMSTLVTLPRSSLLALSVGALKQVLWEARVRVPPGIVEKEELVERVWAIVEEERRKDNEGIDDTDFETTQDETTEDIEEPERDEMVWGVIDPDPELPQEHRQENDRYSAAEELGGPETTRQARHSAAAMDSGIYPQSPTSQPPTLSPRPSTDKPKLHSPSKPSSVDRSGLCVICQDEEANIAIVDCGHLAMCRACSDLVLASSKECPLCRTRIVTEARLLRIFKA